MDTALTVRVIGDADQVHRLLRALEGERYVSGTFQTKDGDLLHMDVVSHRENDA